MSQLPDSIQPTPANRVQRSRRIEDLASMIFKTTWLLLTIDSILRLYDSFLWLKNSQILLISCLIFYSVYRLKNSLKQQFAFREFGTPGTLWTTRLFIKASSFKFSSCFFILELRCPKLTSYILSLISFIVAALSLIYFSNRLVLRMKKWLDSRRVLQANSQLFSGIPLLSSEEIKRLQPNFCLICLEIFNAKHSVLRLKNCGDSFHFSCCKTWIENRRSCPHCKKIVKEMFKIRYV